MTPWASQPPLLKGLINRPRGGTLSLASVLLLLSLASANVVNTNDGKFRGKVTTMKWRDPFSERTKDAEIVEFLGIPYAKPPVSDRRFSPPEKLEPLTSNDVTRDATQQPNSCMQSVDTVFPPSFKGSSMWNANTPKSEDCLYLNVWAPKQLLDAPMQNKVAVMIWIFGGGFYSGTSTLDVYDLRLFALEQNIVVASMNYRVGVFGFLYLGSKGAPGNVGFLDQRMAIEWIVDNAQVFGGDNTRVTIMGESAGSVSVSLHVALQTSGVKRAIMQSGTALAEWSTLPAEEAISRAKLLGEQLECGPSMTLERCLKAKMPEEIVEKEYKFVGGVAQFPFTPVVDGVLIKKPIEDIIINGEYKSMELLMGMNKNEGTYFMLYSARISDFKSPLNPHHVMNYTEQTLVDHMDDYFSGYPRWPFENDPDSMVMDAIKFQYEPFNVANNNLSSQRIIDTLDSAVGDYHFACPVINWATAWVSRLNPDQAMPNLPKNNKAYVYLYAHRSSLQPWPAWIGVMHGDEISFVFGEPLRLSLNFTPNEKKLSKYMMQYWSNFGKTGNPNLDEGGRTHSFLKTWEEFKEDGTPGLDYIKLSTDLVTLPNTRNAPKPWILSRPKERNCEFWRRYLPQLYRKSNELKKKSAPVTDDSSPATCSYLLPVVLYIPFILLVDL